MSNASTLIRSLTIYGLCLPLAIWLGYLLATPQDYTTLEVVGLILTFLAIPLFLRWHHPWLIASLNMSAVIFILPGRPQLWMPLAGICLLIGTFQYALNRKMRFVYVPSVAYSLLFLAAVVLLTARLTGGIGIRAFGGSVYGGRNYVMLLGAIVAYFALTSRPIPPERAVLYVALYFLGGATMAISNLAGHLNPQFNFLFWIFPVENISALTNDVAVHMELMWRTIGLPFLSIAVFCSMLALYGIRGILDGSRPLRILIFVFFVCLGTLGGFRSVVVIFLLTFTIQFYMEGLFRTRLLPIFVLALILGGTLMITFATRLPLSVQRSLSFLPIEVDPIAKLDAQTSTNWRLHMWRDLIPEIPKYLILGKGYAINASDLEMSTLEVRRFGEDTIQAELAGDYHNGPLSVIVPFGLFGVAAFLWFIVAGFKALYRNYQFGDPALHRINTFLFAYYVARVLMFLVVFGSLYSELVMFTGLVGMSISLNHGVAQPVRVPQPQIAFNRFRLSPGVRRPVGA